MSSKKRYDIAPYTDIEIPTYNDTYHPQHSNETANWSQVVTIANVLLAIIIIIGMLWDGRSVVVSIIAGSLYYAATTLGVISLVSGQAAAIWHSWQTERTRRYYIDAHADIYERKLELDAAVTPAQLPAHPVQPPGVPDTYVPAYAPGAVDEAMHWLRGLYDRSGNLDPRRVRSGYVQGAVVGSKRSGGSAEAKQVLIDNRVIKPVEGGHVFNVRRYPTLAQVDALQRSLQDVVGG